MSSNRTSYTVLGRYNGTKCSKSNYLEFSDGKGWDKFEDRENFLSLYAAVRRPFNPAYWDPNYVQPFMPGVN